MEGYFFHIHILRVFIDGSSDAHMKHRFDCRQLGETVQFALLGFIGGVTVNSVLLNQSRIAAFRLHVQSRAFILSSKKNKQTNKAKTDMWTVEIFFLFPFFFPNTQNLLAQQ